MVLGKGPIAVGNVKVRGPIRIFVDHSLRDVKRPRSCSCQLNSFILC